jgi:hypothetical protein
MRQAHIQNSRVYHKLKYKIFSAFACRRGMQFL